jgi:hypothetical protein
MLMYSTEDEHIQSTDPTIAGVDFGMFSDLDMFFQPGVFDEPNVFGSGF